MRMPTTESKLFSKEAREMLTLSRQEALGLHCSCVLSEHLILGALALGRGAGVGLLAQAGLDLAQVRDYLTVVGNCSHETTNGYGKSTKRVFAASSRFSDIMGHPEVDTDHVILGLLDESDGGAAKVWQHFGIDTPKTVEALVRRIADEKSSSSA